MRKSTLAAAVFATVLPFSFLIPATPALALTSCNGTDQNSCDNIWPKDSICANDKELVESTTKSVHDPYTGNTDSVTANLWYSPTCRSVWGQVLSDAVSQSGVNPNGIVYNVNGSNPSQTCTALTFNGWPELECSTKMVNDNGITAKTKATGYTVLGVAFTVITPAW